MTTYRFPETHKNLEPVHRYDDDFDDEDEKSLTLTIQSGYNSNSPRHSRFLRSSIKLKAGSSFPSLLSLYQTPIHEESTTDEHKLQRKKRSNRERRRNERNKVEHEDYQEKRTNQEMRQIRIDAIAREQIDKFENYVQSMTYKVEKQREGRRKYNEMLQERLKEQEEEEKKKLRLHRGPRHVYVHDTSYLKTIPDSQHCRVTRIADKLQQKGLLRTQADIESYWSGYLISGHRRLNMFSDKFGSSVGNSKLWMTTGKPKIEITGENDEITLTDTINLQQTYLPPIHRKLKKAKPPES